MRKRYNLSFNLEDERHRVAHEQLKAQPAKQQSEYAIACILEAGRQEELLQLMKVALREVLSESGGIAVTLPPSLMPNKKKPEQANIREDILSFLNDFQETGSTTNDPQG